MTRREIITSRGGYRLSPIGKELDGAPEAGEWPLVSGGLQFHPIYCPYLLHYLLPIHYLFTTYLYLFTTYFYLFIPVYTCLYLFTTY